MLNSSIDFYLLTRAMYYALCSAYHMSGWLNESAVATIVTDLSVLCEAHALLHTGCHRNHFYQVVFSL